MLPAGEKPNEEVLAEIREDVDKLESSTSTIKAQMASLNRQVSSVLEQLGIAPLNRQTGGGSATALAKKSRSGDDEVPGPRGAGSSDLPVGQALVVPES